MNHDTLQIEFLGTGTSTGVPVIGCDCAVCRSADPRDNRIRTSAIVRFHGNSILIDCGPDFRTQILRASSQKLDALLLTHIHYDHVGGIDDLRAYCYHADFPVYARQDVIDDLKQRLPYCFAEHPYPGVPRLDVVPVAEGRPFHIGDIIVEPFAVMHYKLKILGYRIGPLTYITDAKEISDDVIEQLQGTPLLVINSLRIKPHLSHMCLTETLSVIERINPQKAYIIHMSDAMGLHATTQASLPKGVNLAYDGLIVDI